MRSEKNPTKTFYVKIMVLFFFMQGGMTMNLKEKAKNLPSSPGVYLMKSSLGTIIYVGKSKNLKNRVLSYFQSSNTHTRKVEKLVKNINDFEYIQTDTEFEAFMLECKLIKKLQPEFNRMMKNPRSYAYIVIRMDHEYPTLELTNIFNEHDSNLYFGPYTNKKTAEKAIQGLKEFFRIDCSNPSNRKTACLNYSLNLCIGMCLGKSVAKQYNISINRIISLLSGTDKSILKEIESEMEIASENFDFEKAAKYRDYLEAINSILKKEKVIKFTKANKNIVIIEKLYNNRIKLFLIKGNKVLFREKYTLDGSTVDQIAMLMKTNMEILFQRNSRGSFQEINKDEIDEAQIIYSYLKASTCTYKTIPNTWLSSKNQEKIEKTIIDLLKQKL